MKNTKNNGVNLDGQADCLRLFYLLLVNSNENGRKLCNKQDLIEVFAYPEFREDAPDYFCKWLPHNILKIVLKE